MELTLNGEPVDAEYSSDGYLSIERRWKPSDELTVRLPMHLTALGLPDGSSNYSFLYGPVVLGSRIGKERQDGLFADESRGGHIAAGPKLPLQDMPVIVGDKGSLLGHIEPVEGSPLTFTLHGAYPEKYEGMTLEPFSRIHESRYMVYWPLLSEQEFEQRQEELRAEEKAAAELDAKTVDVVVCGEQQPESDHFVKMESSRSGDEDGVHWRVPARWFSYEMEAVPGESCAVRVSFRPAGDGGAEIYVDGIMAGRFGTGDPASPVVAEFALPDGAVSGDTVEVKISASGDGARAPRIYEVRIVRR